jgi:chromosomal replication initiation ATPase DnaA
MNTLDLLPAETEARLRALEVGLSELQRAERVRTAPAARGVTCALIIQLVSFEFGVPVRDILSDRRDQKTVEARHVGYWLARETTNQSLPMIAKAFDRDHTTIMHGADVIKALKADSPLVRRAHRLLELFLGAQQ